MSTLILSRFALASVLAGVVAIAGCSNKDQASVAETVATGDGNFLRLAVDSTGVYWTVASGAQTSKVLGVSLPSSDKIDAPLTGDDIVEIAIEQDGPLGITLDGASIYFADLADGSASIKKVSRSGGMPTVLASGQKRPYALAVVDKDIFWTDTDAGTVMRAPVAGGEAEALAQQQDGPEGIAADALRVYWVNAKGGTVEKLDVSLGKGQKELTTGLKEAHDLGIDPVSSTVYFATTGAEGKVMSAAPDASGPTSIASDPNIAAGGAISVDLQGVYWLDVEGSTFTVMKAPLAGGSASEVGTGTATAVFDLFAYGDYVFVLASDGQKGSVMRVRK